MKRRDQPCLDPSLTDLEGQFFDWPLDLRRWPMLEDLPGVDVGIADHPEAQTQCRERLPWSSFSALFFGGAGSGRTSLLRALLAQTADAFTNLMAAIVDPTTTSPELWNQTVTGPGAWVVVGALDDNVSLLIEQLELLVVQADSVTSILVVIDRIDLVAATMTDEAIRRLAALISGGPRRGIYFCATADTRTPLEATLSRSFIQRYHFAEAATRILRHTDRDYLVRVTNPPQLRRPYPLEDVYPLGPVSAAKASILMNDPDDQSVALGTNDVRHEPVWLPSDQPLVIFGGSPASRFRTLRALVGSLTIAGCRVGVLDADVSVDGTINIFEGMFIEDEGVRRLKGGTLDEALRLATDWTALDVIVVPQVDRMERWMRQRMASEDFRADWVAGQLTAVKESLKRLVRDFDVVPWGGYRMAQFSADTHFGGLHLMDQASFLYISPRPAVLMGADYGETRGLIAAAPQRRYGPEMAVAVIDGERIEISNLVGGHAVD